MEYVVAGDVVIFIIAFALGVLATLILKDRL